MIYIRLLTPILVPLLLAMSAAKFALVVMFFMHLRYDAAPALGPVRGPAAHRARPRGGADDADRRLPGLRPVTRDCPPPFSWTSGSIHAEVVLAVGLLRGVGVGVAAARGAAAAGAGRAVRGRAAGRAVALNGPLHDLSDYYLFSAHMVQHLLLTLVVPPLLLTGDAGLDGGRLLRPCWPSAWARRRAHADAAAAGARALHGRAGRLAPARPLQRRAGGPRLAHRRAPGAHRRRRRSAGGRSSPVPPGPAPALRRAAPLPVRVRDADDRGGRDDHRRRARALSRSTRRRRGSSISPPSPTSGWAA